MTQGILPFKYEIEKKESGMTALAGLPIYLDLAKVIGLSKSIEKHLKIRENTQGWTDVQMVLAIVMMNIAGGSNVSDLKTLEADAGFCELLRRAESHGLKRKIRRVLERRWRKEKKRTIPSSSAVFRYLNAFHDIRQKEDRINSEIKAFIPTPNKHLKGLMQINREMLSSLQSQTPQLDATLDMDATLVETNKNEALYCYKKFKSYQPLNVYWAEQDVIVHSEFRDGNVPAGYEQLRILKEALTCLPANVEKVMLRSDTAGYQHDLLKYCETGENRRFGRIEFAIGAKVTSEFKKAVAQIEASEWKPLYKIVSGCTIKTDTELAQVRFVPNEISHSKNGLEYRYIAKRQALKEQIELPGMGEDTEPEGLPFPTLSIESKRYKLFGIVTNISESKMAWWGMMILALNLNAIMKKIALDKSMENSRMKTVRFSIINIPGRIIKRSRSMILRLSRNHPAFDILVEARRRIACLVPATG